MLAELGSINRAAEALNLSPPAVHKQLKVLEQELGLVLYEKVGRRLRLTQAAQALLPHAQALLAQHEATLLAVDEIKGLRRGFIRIGAGVTFGSYVLPALLRQFRAAYPSIELIVELGALRNLAAALDRNDIDIAFLAAVDFLRAYDFREVRRWRFSMYLAAHRQRNLPSPCPVSLLESLPFLLYKEDSLFDTLTSDYFNRIGFRPTEVMRLNSADIVKSMVGADLGIAMLPGWMLDDANDEGPLRVVHSDAPPLQTHMALLTRRSSYLPEPVRAFVEMVGGWDEVSLGLRT